MTKTWGDHKGLPHLAAALMSHDPGQPWSNFPMVLILHDLDILSQHLYFTSIPFFLSFQP